MAGGEAVKVVECVWRWNCSTHAGSGLCGTCFLVLCCTRAGGQNFLESVLLWVCLGNLTIPSAYKCHT